jgi:hypothetical protein
VTSPKPDEDPGKVEEFMRLFDALPREKRKRLACFLLDEAARKAARPRGQPWEEVGRALYEEKYGFLDRALRFSRTLPKSPDPPQPVEATVYGHLHDVSDRLHASDVSGLIAYLRSEQPLSRHERDCLATYLEDDKPPDSIAGRPRNELNWELLESAELFYEEWKKRNKKAKIRDRGFRKKMKYLSCDYTVAVQKQAFGEGSGPTPEALLRDLKRPKNRRNRK